MEVRLLGPVELVDQAGERVELTGAKMRGLLGVLAIEAGRVLTPQRLIDVLWGEQEIHGQNVVQGVVSKLRKATSQIASTSIVVTRPAGYELGVPRDRIDLFRFEDLVERARRAPPDEACDLLTAASALWRGPPLGGAPNTPAIDAIRARLSEMRESALDDLIDAQLALGQHHRLIGDLEAMIADDPLRERRWGQLMKALYGAGRQVDATRAFQRARDVLVEAVGAEPGPELRRLEAAVLEQDDEVLIGAAVTSGRPVGDGFRRSGNMRYATGPCIGRQTELRRIIDQLEGHRCVTLTGPGGVGKTRLALEVCAKEQGRLADGVWWTDLRSTSSPAELLTSILQCLGVDAPAGDDLLARATTVLMSREALLVLDNCEHVLEAVAAAISHLLPRCEGLRVLATSREPLGVESERVIAVEPLGVDAARAFFEMHAEGADAHLDADRELVDVLCARLDRLPLALELAAARARHLRLGELLARLGEGTGLLGSTRGDRRSLGDVADWSYQLLDAPERRMFERLSVFGDGATADAATAVCGVGDLPDVETLLFRLVDKSLIVADRSSPTTRFRMLQTLADFASSRLHDLGEEHETHLAHARWVAGLAATVEFGAETTGAMVAAVEDEHVAVRDAVEWAVANDPELALEITNSLAAFWFGSMRVSQGFELLAAALAAADTARTELRASALGWMGLFATMLQDDARARSSMTEAAALEAAIGDPNRLGRLCVQRVLAAGYVHDGEWSRWVDEARTHFQAASNPTALGYVSFAEGAVSLVIGDGDRASACLRSAITEFGRRRDHLGSILAVSRLGELAIRQGDVGLYADMHAQLRELGREGRAPGVVAGATARLAHARLIEGDVAEAERLARAALASSGGGFMPVVDGYVLRSAGLANLALDHVEQGQDQLRAAIAAFENGAGGVGVGQAALCWIDLGACLAQQGDGVAARAAAQSAAEAATRAGDPWIVEQVEHFVTELASVEPER